MKLNQLITEEKELAPIYLKGVKQTGVLKIFKGNLALSRGREEEIVSETVRLIKAGFVSRRALWNYFEQARSALRLQGDVNSIVHAVGSIRRLTADHAPATTEALYNTAIEMQNLIEANNTLYGGIYKCKDVLDELAGLALKRYPLNNNEREVDEQVSFYATLTLKGLGVWKEYQQALADGGTL